MSEPIVSVIIPTYNRAALLPQALESALAQTFKATEIIVINDGSVDETATVLDMQYAGRVRVITQSNQGIAAARNAGIRAAGGRYIAFLDSDDRWLPEKLAKQVSYLEAHPAVGLLATHLWECEVGSEQTRIVSPPAFPRGFHDLLRGPNFVQTSTVMVRRECLELVGLFDPELPTLEDWELWLRIARRFAIACLPDVLCEHRYHPHNTTKDMAAVYHGLWQFYAKIDQLYWEDVTNWREWRTRANAYRYLLGTTLLKRGQMRQAFGHIAGALSASRSVGAYFAKTRSRLIRAGYLLKPYAALLIGLCGTIGSAVLPGHRLR